MSLETYLMLDKKVDEADRVTSGRKLTHLGQPNVDLRLDVFTEEGWRPVHMRLGGFLADFLCENEEALFPPFATDGRPTGLRGGAKYLAYLRDAWRYGWEKAEEELQRERTEKEGAA